MHPNETPIRDGKYYLMCDVDNYSCDEYDTIEEARAAFEEAVENGAQKMWIGRGEDFGCGHVEIIFQEGETA